MSVPVVVAGEALIDLAPRPNGALSPLIGGGPFNTARALARLGRPTAFLGCVSTDRFGRDIAKALAADGAALDDRLRSERPTSLAVAELDDQGVASYRFHLAETAALQLTPDLALSVLPNQIAALHVGSLGLVLDPMASALEAVVQRAAGQALIMTDPNVRPAVIGDLTAYAARLWRVIAATDVVKVSDADLAILMPEQVPLDAARSLLDLGPRLVLLTLGAEGAVAIGRFGERAVKPAPVKVVDTIGAGDIFSGAWLAHWLDSQATLDNADAIAATTAYACHAASLSCARPGASPPSAKELADSWRY